MAAVVQLRGITWNHTRGYVPLIATAQRFSELYPHITITWSKRSLQEFADYPVSRLAENFDLLIIDHPFVGHAARHPLLFPLDEHLPAAFLADQALNSVGRSHESYAYGGHQWALAIDAATPVSSYRPDLLAQKQVPRSWEDLIALARQGLVAVPAIPVDSLMHFYMLCCALGEEPFTSQESVISTDVGISALQSLRELISYCDPVCLERNPIALYEAMVSTDQSIYCPFSYGYVNYARPEYAHKPLCFANLVRLNGTPLRSTLGGAGLAISLYCQQVEAALAYVQFVADPVTQRGIYFSSGGQPGHRQAWLDTSINQTCSNFFLNTLATLDSAYLRPRYDGAISLQDHAALIVHRYLREGGDPRSSLNELNTLYQESRRS